MSFYEDYYARNLYYQPEKNGFTLLGEVDFSDGCYQFDLLIVLQDNVTGRLYYAEDSGCSCPSPFESVTREELAPASGADEIRSRLDYRYSELVAYEKEYRSYYSQPESARVMDDIIQLMRKVREAEKTFVAGEAA